MGQIAERGQSRDIGPSQLQVLSGNLRTLEQEMRRLALETEDLAALVKYLFLRREALSFQDPFRFLEEASSLYSFTAEQISHGFGNPDGGKEAICYGMQQ